MENNKNLVAMADRLKDGLSQLNGRVSRFRKQRRDHGVTGEYDKMLDLKCLFALNKIKETYAMVDTILEDYRLNGDEKATWSRLDAINNLLDSFELNCADGTESETDFIPFLNE